ncbi:hypothetical protein [Microbacterium sp. NC79]|nr:hypothetical protein [Microbacterium sp. NC79]
MVVWRRVIFPTLMLLIGVIAVALTKFAFFLIASNPSAWHSRRL